ncbi:hypothetical protein BIW11_04247, partial [Tropilaelaps mercedesae]
SIYLASCRPIYL